MNGPDLDSLADRLDALLADTDRRLVAEYPGPRAVRQPVHTVYVPADRYDASTLGSWREQALDVLGRHGGTAVQLAAATGLAVEVVEKVLDRVRAKLDREPVEDLRIDFEDGYGVRPDEDEDAAVVAAAHALALTLGSEGPPRPAYYGIRFKGFEAPTRRRGLRSLALFVGELAGSDALGDGLVLTLPKVTAVEQVEAMVFACAALERAHGLATGRLRFEVQVETPQAVLGADGAATVARLVHAAEGRCVGLHFGTYDYSASLGIAAAQQSLEHPAADHAKAVMQVAAAGTGAVVVDGSTNVLPVGDRDAVHAAWRLHARLVRRALERGFYQGWDLHPAQLPTRFLATYAFFRSGLPAATTRLAAYAEGGSSGYLDEPATAAALAGFVLRGLECGAVDEADLAGLHRADLERLAWR